MITAKRLPDWRPRLATALLMDPNAPHAWGSADCFMGLVVPAVIALVGVDIGAPYRGRYKSQAEADALVKAEGFETVVDFIASQFPEIHPSQLGVGDIAALPADTGAFGLGVVGGGHIQVIGVKGAGTVRLLRAQRGFKVG